MTQYEAGQAAKFREPEDTKARLQRDFVAAVEHQERILRELKQLRGNG